VTDRKWVTKFTDPARRDVRALPRQTALRILRRLADLEADPLGSDTTELVDHPGCRRLRIGDYRVVYRLGGARVIILVVAVAHRADIYQRLRDRTD